MLDTKVCLHCNLELPLSMFRLKNPENPSKRGRCIDCHNAYYRARYHANKDRYLKIQQKSLSKRKAEGKDIYASIRTYRKRYPDRHCEKQNLRRTTKLNATPPWLSELHRGEIKNLYWLAQDLFLVSGQEYHVDHIVPLKGKNVCGLHVPWNLQVLPADINIAKGNKIKET